MRWHRSWRDAADLGMMGPRGDEEVGTGLGSLVTTEDRRHDRDIGQVRSAAKRIVAQVTIAAGHHGEDAHDVSHSMPHRTEVDRNMRRVGNQRSVAAKDGAAVVAAFLDVHADRCSPQHFTHRIGNSLQSSGDDFQQHGIVARTCCLS